MCETKRKRDKKAASAVVEEGARVAAQSVTATREECGVFLNRAEVRARGSEIKVSRLEKQVAGLSKRAKPQKPLQLQEK